MKQKFFLVMALLVAAITFSACSSDDDDDSDKQPTKTYYSEVGVWESGNYFISLSSDHFLTAYVAPNFIDCGSYARSNDNVITSSNSYYVKSTTYSIKLIDKKSMKIDVAYTDVNGNSKSTSLTLSKSNKTPTTKDNPLVGKNFSWQSLHGVTTLNFNTYNTGTQSSTWVNFTDYPLTLYYIYFNGYVYYQQFWPKGRQIPSIGGWGTKADSGEIIVSKVTFSNDGSIQNMIGVTDERL